MKILALDLGEKRTGLALLKEGFILGAGVIAGYQNLEKMFTQLAGVIKKENVTRAVYGLPCSKSGEQEKKYKAIAQQISQRYQLPLEGVNETLTTVEAQRRGGKQCDDNEEAAKIILEDYLNSLTSKNKS
ncbi:MAG TPA: Holliday junction resolvase RuvX [bacterium]|nr:Holliday junction resolvase RuvX [bacterium]HOR57191.1 Holliday junction resolvase RuvX [bacterium]HPL56206.1 Holliday junction resolvase RuvX [bacterium]